MPRKTKQRAWVIERPDGELLLATVRSGAAQCKISTGKLTATHWDKLADRGWLCRRVTVEVDDEGRKWATLYGLKYNNAVVPLNIGCTTIAKAREIQQNKLMLGPEPTQLVEIKWRVVED